ncbi:MAG: DNA translocase FtsK [Bacteroidales bacterium]|nr:DNA translocase FtsK [Bacteroidales bacterium]
MDDFDIELNNIRRQPETPAGGNGVRAPRVVRRHDTPNLRQPQPFEDNEPVVSPVKESRRQPNTDADLPYYEVEGTYAGHEATVSSDRKRPSEMASPAQKRSGAAAATAQSRRKRVAQTPEKYSGGITKFIFDRRFHIFLGIFAVVIAAAMCVVLFSHLRNAATDQSLVLNNTVEQMAHSGHKVANAGGAFGAWLSHTLFTDAFGLGAFVIAIYLFAIGGCLIAKWKINFWSFTFKCLLLAITVSVVAGLITYSADTAVLWGGTHGRYVNKYLFDTTDWMGAAIVTIVLLAAVVCTFYYPIKRVCRHCRKYMPTLKRNYSDPQSEIDSSYAGLEGITPETERPQPAAEALPVAEGTAGTTANPAAGPMHPASATDADSNDAPQAESASSPTAFSIDGGDVHDQKPQPADEGFSLDGPTLEVNRPALDSDSGAIVIDGPDDTGTEMADDKYDPYLDLPNFVQPELSLLEDRVAKATVDKEELEENIQKIVKTLRNYKIEIAHIKATVGPTITLYEIIPQAGVRIAQIKNLEDDIALSLSAKGIRIIAPIPGRGTVGIEVPNNDPQTVSMRSVLSSPKFVDSKKALPVALGATISNDVFVVDVASMPHALVAGATGQGKSVGLNAIIASLIYKKHPSDLKFVLVDPKMVEFSLYAKLEKHYLAKLPDGDDDPIVTDSNRVLAVLNSLCVEMDQRYALLKDAGVRDIVEYNKRFVSRVLNPEKGHKYLPYIVVIIDEFADLIMMGGKEIESPVTRITQKARAVGMHMIIATQRPSTNVLTGLIKANCPARIAFRVNQMVDSRTILDRPGANQLIGRGDMLYSAGGAMERVQCAFISTDEVERICDFVNAQVGFAEPYMLPDPMLAAAAENPQTGRIAGGSMDRDVLFNDCARFLVQQPSASTSILQRRFEIGYNRAGKIIDQLEACGVVGPGSGNKPRAVLVDPQTLEHILSQG